MDKFESVLALATVRERLNQVLRTANTRKALRVELVQLSADLEDHELAESAPPTERAPIGYPAPWLAEQGDDCAPSTDRGSPAGQEFGT